jgi:hypothetical protein
MDTSNRSLQAQLSELEAEIKSIIQQANIEEGDSLGSVAMKLMKTTSVQEDDYPVIEASADPDSLDGIIFQVMLDDGPDVVRMDKAHVIEIAQTPPN